MGTLPRLPFMIFERTGVAGHHSLVRDDLAYCDMVTDRQQRACDIVREHHVLTVSRVERRTSALSDALTPAPKFAVGGWVWVYNTAATIHQGAETDTDAKVLKAKSSRSTGRAPSMSSQLAPAPPLTPRTTPLWAPSSHIRIYPPTCPARMLAVAFRYNDSSPVPPPTSMATCRRICQQG